MNILNHRFWVNFFLRQVEQMSISINQILLRKGVMLRRNVNMTALHLRSECPDRTVASYLLDVSNRIDVFFQ